MHERFDFEDLPTEAAIYIFARRFGLRIEALYVGKAISLRSRIKQQSNNLKLMQAIDAAWIGHRVLIYGTLNCRPGQRAVTVLDIVERALIDHLTEEDHHLINKVGTKVPVDTIEFDGNRGATRTSGRRGTVPRCGVRPRLGQRSFRIAVLDSYARKCAVTDEKTLPALEAAHIRDYRDVEEHTISNGILFRAGIHKLFDAGYVTVTPDYHFEVSHRIKEEFENGQDYYKLHGREIRLPANPVHKPLADALTWHNEQRFRG